jgi:hypothetical protein
MNFFVYLHRRKTNGKVFYVGKGTRYRHKTTWGRNPHWWNIVNKHGYTIEIVETGMQEWWALELERELILKYKDQGLANLTDGGEGMSGYVYSEKTLSLLKQHHADPAYREYMRKTAKARYTNPEYMEAHKERQKLIMSNPAVREKIRQKAIKKFESPEARELARKITLAMFENPAVRENSRQKALARFDTPEKRSKHAQAKPIICLETGQVFGTGTLAAEWITSLGKHKGDNSFISSVCRGKKPHAYGYHWAFMPSAMEGEAGSQAD